MSSPFLPWYTLAGLRPRIQSVEWAVVVIFSYRYSSKSILPPYKLLYDLQFFDLVVNGFSPVLTLFASLE